MQDFPHQREVVAAPTHRCSRGGSERPDNALGQAAGFLKYSKRVSISSYWSILG